MKDQKKPLLGCIKTAWQDRARLGDKNLATTQRQFLPAALEIQDTPPSPAGRWLSFSLMALFSIGILWASFGEVDIVVTAPGRVIPSGQVKIIQPLETGTVKRIHVRDGDTVQQGQPLISLDTTYAGADKQRIHQQLMDLSLQVSWREALEYWLDLNRQQETDLQFSVNVSQQQQQKARQLYAQQRDELKARLNGLHKEQAAAEAELATVAAELNRVELALPILNEQVKAYKYLYDKQYGAKVQYLQIKQQQVELEKSIPILESRQRQFKETAASLESRTQSLLLEQRKNNLLELERLTNEIAVLEQDAIKAQQRERQQILIAPVSGTVQQLAIHTIGGVVTPAQELMKIVPKQAHMEVEALVQNKDIGFINAGQVAEVKVDTFNFTKYGVIDAEVKHIAQDAIPDEALGWVFPMILTLEREVVDVESKAVRLSPGMSITAEVKTGKRRLIEFFLSPLLRYRQESVRER